MLDWGLPATASWSQDTIAAVRTLGAVETWPEHWRGRYPPLQYLILNQVYKPILHEWERTGEMTPNYETGGFALAPPHAPKLGRLFRVARLTHIVMACLSGLLLYATARHWTRTRWVCFLAAGLWLACPVVAYFARLGNVDVPCMFWFCASLLAYVRLLHRRTLVDALLLGLCGSLAMATKDGIAGVYPGMAVALLIATARAHRHAGSLGLILKRTILQPAWLVGMLAFVLPYLYLNATWANWSAYADRMSYWLGWTEGTMHTQQFHWPNQVALLGATFWYAASGVGWPLLAALLAAVAYGWAHFRRWTLALLAPCISYYLIVIVSTGFVYTRFLMPVFASLLLIFALAVRHAWRRRPRSLAREVQRATRRRDVLAALLLLVIGSTAAYTRGLQVTSHQDTRYAVEQWFAENVPTTATVGAFSKPQYMPRLHDQGYAVYPVEMSDAALRRPQPEYLVLTSQNYEDYRGEEAACLQRLLAGQYGYEPIAKVDGVHVGKLPSMWYLAAYGSPGIGKLSPTVIVLRRADEMSSD
jgi:hypothetical protein